MNTIAVDAATLRDSPASRRGLRRRGGKGVVCANHSKKAIHLIGAPGNGTLDLQFHENLKGESCVVLVEYARWRHKKIGVIADNAGALTGRDTEEYIAGTNGAGGIIHIPPHTPQLSPIETEWREIKAAIADIFGGPDKMRDAIIRMLHNKEMPIVGLFERLLPLVCPPRARQRPEVPHVTARLLAPPCHLSPPRDSSGRARRWAVIRGRFGCSIVLVAMVGSVRICVVDFIANFVAITMRLIMAC